MDWSYQISVVKILLENVSNIVAVEDVNIGTHAVGGFTSKLSFVDANVVVATGSAQKISRLTFPLVMKYLDLDTSTDVMDILFTKEILMYKTAIPRYIGIQNKMKLDHDLMLDIFPEFIGSDMGNFRYGKGVFLMKDLRVTGFLTAEKMDRLDLEHTKLVVDKLAYFHAIGIKLKDMNSKIFEDDFKELIKPALRNMNNPNKVNIDLEFIEKIKIILKSNVKLEEFTGQVVNLIEKINKEPLPVIKEPFSTLLHNDLWKNNLLFKYNVESEIKIPTHVKFIDFQFVIHNSPVRDLVYFLYTSSSSCVQKDFEQISSYYYERFINYLILLKHSDVNKFNRNVFNEEIKIFAWTKFKHILSTILLICETDDRDMTLLNLFQCFESNGWFE